MTQTVIRPRLRREPDPRRAPAPPQPGAGSSAPAPDICVRALAARDPRFDGLFYVGITTTMIYCRPVCPARVSYPERRRFFGSAAAAERDGFRPCLRCRPELAPGRAVVDAVPRIARAAALRIAAGALNGSGVKQLARELGVGERQLRRAMKRELGVSPLELAQTHRLLLAKCLLTDTTLPVTRVAYASGFQSLRRFNSVFHDRYRMSPTALRRSPRSVPVAGARPGPGPDLLRLTLAYRAPLAWQTLLRSLAAGAWPGVEAIEGGRYCRTVALGEAQGIVLVEAPEESAGHRDRRAGLPAHVVLAVSNSLLPVLMPLLARLRHLLDLDAEPTVIDAQLAETGLAAHVARSPGLRTPGAFDAFEVACRELLRLPGCSPQEERDLVERVAAALAEPAPTMIPSLTRFGLTAERVASAGESCLISLGVPERQGQAIVALARAVRDRTVELEPGADVATTLRRLQQVAGIEEWAATAIVARALHWPDAFPAGDPVLQRAAGAAGPQELLRMAEQWRPWRAYAAAHLRLQQAPGA